MNRSKRNFHTLNHRIVLFIFINIYVITIVVIERRAHARRVYMFFLKIELPVARRQYLWVSYRRYPQ